jgi:phospholipid N-methyltransferase
VVRSQLAERGLFLRAFLAHPRRVGAVLPTSGQAVAVMLDMAPLAQADLVVELGAGTGAYTRTVLERLGPQARLVAFEIDPALAQAVRDKLPDQRLVVVTGSAEQVEDVLEGQRPDVVVSALPFTTLPAGTGRRILERTARVLAPSGVLLVLQYSPFIARELSRLFSSIDRRVCPLNVPPAFLYACRQPLATASSTSDDGA